MTARAGLLRRLFRDRGGALLAEAAIMLSLTTMLALSGVEIARYTLLHQKLERVAASVGDLVAQAETLTETDITNILAAVEHVARPFDMSVKGKIIISSIGATNGNPPAMYWQRSGGGSYAGSSRIGTPGSSLNLPADFTVASGDTVIAAEVVFEYTPWMLSDIVGATEVYHEAFFRPRFGALTQID